MPADNHEATTSDLLRAIRSFGDAHDRMLGSIKKGMRMNITDVATLRLLIMREEAGEMVTPMQISKHLGISTASTTKLLDRLEASGHVARQPHPTDRRGRTVVLTDAARREFYEQFGTKLQLMRSAMEPFSAQQLEDATNLLLAIGDALDSE